MLQWWAQSQGWNYIGDSRTRDLSRTDSVKLKWQPKNLWWKTHGNKLSLLHCHLHEQVDKSNKLVDLFVKLKCQFHTLGSMKNIHSQARAGWVFLKKFDRCCENVLQKSQTCQYLLNSSVEELHVPLMECLNLSFLHLNWEFKLLSSSLNALKEGSQRQISLPVLFFFNNMFDYDSLLATQPDLSWKAHFVVKEPRGTPKLHSTKSPGATHCSWKSNKSNGWDHTMITSSLTTLLR